LGRKIAVVVTDNDKAGLAEVMNRQFILADESDNLRYFAKNNCTCEFIRPCYPEFYDLMALDKNVLPETNQ